MIYKVTLGLGATFTNKLGTAKNLKHVMNIVCHVPCSL